MVPNITVNDYIAYLRSYLDGRGYRGAQITHHNLLTSQADQANDYIRSLEHRFDDLIKTRDHAWAAAESTEDPYVRIRKGREIRLWSIPEASVPKWKWVVQEDAVKGYLWHLNVRKSFHMQLLEHLRSRIEEGVMRIMWAGLLNMQRNQQDQWLTIQATRFKETYFKYILSEWIRTRFGR